MQMLCSAIETCWESVGKGSASFVVAAFITNVHYASLQQVVEDLLQHNDKMCVSDLVKTCNSFRGDAQTVLREQKIVGSDSALMDRLQDISTALKDRHDEKDTPVRHDLLCARCGHTFATKVQQDVIQGKTGSNILSAVLVKNLSQWASGNSLPENAVMASTPAVSDVEKDQKSDAKHQKESWLAAFASHVLTQSYHTHLRSSKELGLVAKCRITALQLAQRISSQASKVLQDENCFPCRCSQTLGFHLDGLVTELQRYASHKCWDLVSQAPWVAGNHILEMLWMATYYGRYLLKYRHYMGSVLHCYNALTELGGLAKISVLDKLCHVYRETLFPGGSLPKVNFHACWARYVGARLRFPKNHNGKNTHDNWCLSIPTHAQRAAAGVGLPSHCQKDPSSCLIFAVKRQRYHISDRQRDEMEEIYAKELLRKSNNKKNNSSKKTIVEDLSELPPEEAELHKLLPPLLATARALLSSPSRDSLPEARIDLYTVFEKCVKVIGIMSNKMHKDVADRLLGHEYCICFATSLLEAADRVVKGRRFGKLETWKLHERKMLDDMKEAIMDVFGRVKEEDIVWQI
jgi:hypothetical protein